MATSQLGSRTVRVVLVGSSQQITLPRNAVVLADSTTADAVPAVRRHRPDVVVVDAEAGESVLDVVASVHEIAPVLTVTREPRPSLTLNAVVAGATSHLVGAVPADALARTADNQAVYSPGLADLVFAHSTMPLTCLVTRRECDVLALVAEGLTARQVAKRLVLSPRTVENHLHNMMKKLGVRNRASLVRFAIEHGLA